MSLINVLMNKRMLSLSKKSMDVNRIFISVKKNNLCGSIGVGILTSNYRDIFSEKVMCLRFLEKDNILMHQLCSLIYVYQKCNLQSDKRSLILMDPLEPLMGYGYNKIGYDEIRYDKIDKMEEVIETIPYVNTVYSLLHNKQVKIDRLKSMCYRYSICNRLAYFASDTNHIQGIDDSIKLFNGKKIGVKFLFNE